MTKQKPPKHSIVEIDGCLHHVLKICDKLEEITGHSYHVEAINAIIPQYQDRDDYRYIQDLGMAMAAFHCNSPVLLFKGKDTPDTLARKELFNTLAQICMEAGVDLNPLHERRLATRLDILFGKTERDKIKEPAAFMQLIDALPKAMAQHRQELELLFEKEMYMLTHTDMDQPPPDNDHSLRNAGKHGAKVKATKNKDNDRGQGA